MHTPKGLIRTHCMIHGFSGPIKGCQALVVFLLNPSSVEVLSMVQSQSDVRVSDFQFL